MYVIKSLPFRPSQESERISWVVCLVFNVSYKRTHSYNNRVKERFCLKYKICKKANDRVNGSKNNDLFKFSCVGFLIANSVV